MPRLSQSRQNAWPPSATILLLSPLRPGVGIVRCSGRTRRPPARAFPLAGIAVVGGGFPGAFFAQALGILQAQFGRLARLLIAGNDAIPGRQLELLGRRARQALELVQVESFNLLPRPIRLLEELHAGFDAGIVVEAIDVQVGVEDVEAVVIDDLRQQLLQAEAMQRVVLVIDIGIHGAGLQRMGFKAVVKISENDEHAAPQLYPNFLPAMAFKNSPFRFQMVDVSLLDPDPAHVRQSINEEALKGLTNAVRKLGIIQPIIVRPTANDRYSVIAGERRRQAAIQAGETQVPVIVRDCSDDEALEVRVFENIGLGVRSALEPRDMATAIQAIAQRFASPEEAAQYFGRAPTWLAQAKAAANLSEKVTALLDAGKISSTGAAVQLEKLARKNEAKAESLIEQIEQLPDGEKMSKKDMDEVLAVAPARSEPTEAAPSPAAPAPSASQPEPAAAAADTPPWEAPTEAPQPTPTPRTKVNPGKVKLVAELLGLSEEDEETILARLIDEFLSLRGG